MTFQDFQGAPGVLGVPGGPRASRIKEKQKKSETSAKSAALSTSLMSFFIVVFMKVVLHCPGLEDIYQELFLIMGNL